MQHGQKVFFPTYCVVCAIISNEIKSLFTSSFAMVWQPQEHVTTFDTCIVLSGFKHTCGADLLCPFSLPGFLFDFIRLFCTIFLKPSVDDDLQLLLLFFPRLILAIPNFSSKSCTFF